MIGSKKDLLKNKSLIYVRIDILGSILELIYRIDP